jgi:hypothetical protein
MIKIVDTIIMAKIGLPCLILFNAPHSFALSFPPDSF